MRKNKEIPENDEGFKKLLEACSLCEKDFTDGLEIDETVEFDPSKRHIRRMKRIIKRERSGRYGRNGRPTAAYIVKRAALAAACLAVVAAVFLIKPIREPVVSLVSDISDNISHPERKEFTGFTVVKKKVTPKNIDGIDVSFAPEESADYDIYSSIGRIAVISVMKNMSVDCDCCAVAEDPCLKDIGVLASTDPIAIDQAALDLVWAAKDDPGQAHFIERVETRKGVHTVEAAAELGFGSREYELIEI